MLRFLFYSVEKDYSFWLSAEIFEFSFYLLEHSLGSHERFEVTRSNLWALQKARAKWWCYVLFSAGVAQTKVPGEDISSIFRASLSALGSQTNHSELIDWNSSLLFSPLIEDVDCRAQIDSDSSHFLPAGWFSPIILESRLQSILSHLLDAR